MSRQQPRRLQGRQPTQEVPTGAQRKLCVPVWQELFDSCLSLRWGLKSPDLFRALAGLIREPHLTGAFRLDCKYVTLAATLSHPPAASGFGGLRAHGKTEAGWWARELYHALEFSITCTVKLF